VQTPTTHHMHVLVYLKPVEEEFVRHQADGSTQLRTTGIITRSNETGREHPARTRSRNSASVKTREQNRGMRE
jgi:hypothetical protein